jgi:hypothetical protein
MLSGVVSLHPDRDAAVDLGSVGCVLWPVVAHGMQVAPPTTKLDVGRYAATCPMVDVGRMPPAQHRD